MNKIIWPIVFRTTIAVFFIVLAIFLFHKFSDIAQFDKVLLIIPFIPATLNILFIINLARIYKVSQNVFFRKYLLFNGVKFLLNIFLLIVLIFLFRSNPVPIIIVYLLSFFILFILEIIEIQTLIRKLSKQ